MDVDPERVRLEVAALLNAVGVDGLVAYAKEVARRVAALDRGVWDGLQKELKTI